MGFFRKGDHRSRRSSDGTMKNSTREEGRFTSGNLGSYQKREFSGKGGTRSKRKIAPEKVRKKEGQI